MLLLDSSTYSRKRLFIGSFLFLNFIIKGLSVDSENMLSLSSQAKKTHTAEVRRQSEVREGVTERSASSSRCMFMCFGGVTLTRGLEEGWDVWVSFSRITNPSLLCSCGQ